MNRKKYKIEYKQEFIPPTFDEIPIHSIFCFFNQTITRYCKISPDSCIVLNSGKYDRYKIWKSIGEHRYLHVMQYDNLTDDSPIHKELIKVSELQKDTLFLNPQMFCCSGIYQVKEHIDSGITRVLLFNKYRKNGIYIENDEIEHEIPSNFFVIPIHGVVQPCQ